MIRPSRLLAPLLALVVFAVTACAELTPAPPPHVPVKATTGGAFETQTLYSCTGSTGGQIVFAKPKSTVSVMVRTGVLWVRPHSGADTSGSSVTTPIPTANTVANGWVRLGDTQSASWGVESGVSTGGPGTIDSVGFLDYWCETQGDLVVVGH
jgi:hypothetical protein